MRVHEDASKRAVLGQLEHHERLKFIVHKAKDLDDVHVFERTHQDKLILGRYALLTRKWLAIGVLKQLDGRHELVTPPKPHLAKAASGQQNVQKHL